MSRQTEILSTMENTVAEQLPLLKTVEDSWQPSDLLPDMSREDWRETLQTMRDKSATLSDDVLVVLVGNIVTEEALPSYQTWLNRITGLRDETGADDTAWGKWTRGWTAEENRHGTALSTYMYMTGRVNLRAVEVTIQNLIRNGFDLKSDNDPYKSLIYASFQERATKISHANTGKLAERCGDSILAKMCSLIAADEARHEEAYKRIMKKVFEVDPNGALVAFAEMMRLKVVMPARLMADGVAEDLFTQFALVAQRSKMYTVNDYAAIAQHLNEYWNIEKMSGLSAQGSEAQEYLCGLPKHFYSKAEKTERILARVPKGSFSWIHGRQA